MAFSVEELSDREEIRQAVYGMFRAGDRRDAELARAVIWEDGYFTSDPVGAAEQPRTHSTLNDRGRAQFEQYFELSNHFAMNIMINVDGDVADTETYAIAYHIVRADREAIVGAAGEARFAELGSDATRRYELWLGLRYSTRLEKRGGVWKMKVSRMVVDWTKFVPYEGLDSGAGVLAFLQRGGVQGKGDQSYDFLPWYGNENPAR